MMNWLYISTFYGMSVVTLNSSPSAQLRTWIAKNPGFFVRVNVTAINDAVLGRVLWSPDCDILANDSYDPTFCKGEGSAYCAHSLMNKNTPEGPYNTAPEDDTDWFAFNTPDEVSLFYRQNCFR